MLNRNKQKLETSSVSTTDCQWMVETQFCASSTIQLVVLTADVFQVLLISFKKLYEIWLKVAKRQLWVRPIEWLKLNSTFQPAWYVRHVRFIMVVAKGKTPPIRIKYSDTKHRAVVKKPNGQRSQRKCNIKLPNKWWELGQPRCCGSGSLTICWDVKIQ